MGALLHIRRSELNQQIKAERPPSAWIHWADERRPDFPDHPYREPSIRQMLSSGPTIAQVKASDLVKNYIEVYTLLFEADSWERLNGQISVISLQQQMVSGGLNDIFRRIAESERQGTSLLRY